MYPSINILTVTGKIYVIIENLTDLIEELNKNPLPAENCGLEGVESVGLEGNGSGSGGGEEEARGAIKAGEILERHGLADPPEKGQRSPEGKNPDLFRYLSSNECLELIRLESTRKSLLRAQGFLEEKKQVLIRLAKSRQVGK